MTPTPPVPLVLTAPTADGLARAAAGAAARAGGTTTLPGLARELAAGADPRHRFRRVVLAGSAADLTAPGPHPVPVPELGRLAFLYSGQSSQRPRQGLQLAAASPRVADALTAVARHAGSRLVPPLDEVVADPGAPGPDGLRAIDRTGHTQPALLALALGLTDLLAAVGVAPDLVCGHSFGEIAAAACAGVWDRAGATTVAVERGRLIEGLPREGTMIAVGIGEDEAAPLLAGTGVELSAVHAPTAVVLAGPTAATRAVAAGLAARGVPTTELAVGGAYHSAAVEPVLEPLRAVLDRLPARPAAVPLVGNADGAVVDAAAPAGPDHWLRHCRRTVRWSSVMATLVREGVTTHLEIGPGAVLGRLAAADLDPAAVVAATGPEPDEVTALLTALVALDARGHAVDWAAVLDELAAWPVPGNGGTR
ncbi:acyltransferase domain-containing protein [Pseudonocardia sp. HH130629-09]|uniref:acyltransferase domain-containing protein n=1 Tax=Pseudonocardia sp. HH130629-09 TaxID=1641402 RepID=UPI0006CB7DA9|nr:acyltransferase domain-containing protein [Pseudonocardia sp. HH130629-09]ALE86644.1 hypothetical protein XF36_29105 [Pseudonocardia sp. HH130629-09]